MYFYVKYLSLNVSLHEGLSLLLESTRTILWEQIQFSYMAFLVKLKPLKRADRKLFMLVRIHKDTDDV